MKKHELVGVKIKVKIRVKNSESLKLITHIPKLVKVNNLQRRP